MNRGLVIKAIRETYVATILFALGLFVVEAILATVLPMFQRQGAEMPMVRQILKIIVGAEMAEQMGPNLPLALRWVHPVVLALFWAHTILFCTRLPAGEVDRGTIDVLLGLPVSRRELFLSDSAAWLVSAPLLLVMAVAGSAAGAAIFADDPNPLTPSLAILAVNLGMVNLAVGAAAWLVSALSDRRGRAIAVVFSIVLATFLLNYLAAFWAPARHLSFLSLLTYYQPPAILRDGAWPVGDMLVLGGTALTCWLAAGLIFSRRDLCTL